MIDDVTIIKMRANVHLIKNWTRNVFGKEPQQIKAFVGFLDLFHDMETEI